MDNNVEHKPEPSSDLYAFDKKTSFRRKEVDKRTPEQKKRGLAPPRMEEDPYWQNMFFIWVLIIGGFVVFTLFSIIWVLLFKI